MNKGDEVPIELIAEQSSPGFVTHESLFKPSHFLIDYYLPQTNAKKICPKETIVLPALQPEICRNKNGGVYRGQ